jgi:Protein of unknown function (DUF4031)
MALFIDKPQLRQVGQRIRWTAHLVSDTSLEELHAFAKALGAPIKAFHDKPGKPHYDIIDKWVGLTLAAGAQPVRARELVQIIVNAPYNQKRAT